MNGKEEFLFFFCPILQIFVLRIVLLYMDGLKRDISYNRLQKCDLWINQKSSHLLLCYNESDIILNFTFDSTFSSFISHLILDSCSFYSFTRMSGY